MHNVWLQIGKTIIVLLHPLEFEKHNADTQVKSARDPSRNPTGANPHRGRHAGTEKIRCNYCSIEKFLVKNLGL
jgi:hypothetical protein